MNIFESLESEVRSYCRSFPALFAKAKGEFLEDNQGREYIDFFSGAGTLNYGHNSNGLQEAISSYIKNDGPLHTLDMMSEAKKSFLETFQELILKPRNLDLKIQFPGPTGTNAVEAALKLARKNTQRTKIACFTNAFHGMTCGSLSITGNQKKRQGAGISLGETYFLPYEHYHGEGIDTSQMIDRYFKDKGSGYDLPAAIILETIQGEGGLNTASPEWLMKIKRICNEHKILLIVDDIQAGCGRSGKFFSFEGIDLSPDIICLSKSLSGIGLPFSLTLFKPELDIWSPGEHNGTFRGNNLAFVSAEATLKHFWKDEALVNEIHKKEKLISTKLSHILETSSFKGKLKGRGLMQGIEFEDQDIAGKISKKCFEKGLIIETSGINDQVLKLLPSLTIKLSSLQKGLELIETSLKELSL